jgi:hypothetical protein
MAALKDTLATLTGWVGDIVDLGLTLALVFLVVDLLFGPTTHIVENVAGLVRVFVDNGVVGLIALVVFAAIYSK